MLCVHAHALIFDCFNVTQGWTPGGTGPADLAAAGPIKVKQKPTIQNFSFVKYNDNFN